MRGRRKEPNPGALMALRHSAVRIRELEQRLEMERQERDARALRLVSDGHTWREVADAAGFANPYIAQLKRRTPADSHSWNQPLAKLEDGKWVDPFVPADSHSTLLGREISGTDQCFPKPADSQEDRA